MSVSIGTHPVRRLGAVCAALAAAVVPSACGGLKRYDNPNVVTGKTAFIQRCGACHTLAHAGTRGIIGPNLDAAFAAAVQDGLGRSAIESVVHGQILEPNPNGAMPAGLAKHPPSGTTSAQLVNDISAYVSQVAAAPGQDTGLLASAGLPPAGTGPPAVEKNGTLAFAADPNGQLSYTTRKAVATAGPVTISMQNPAMGVMHNIAIQTGTSGPVLGAGAIVGTGGTSTIHVTLKPGTYTFFCQVPGTARPACSAR